MATFYVPSQAGWNDNGTLGSAAQLRLKLEKNYNAAANQSTLTLTMQGRAPNYGGRYMLLNNALVKLNNTTLLSGGGNATSSLDYYIDFGGDSEWHNLCSKATGQTQSWTAMVDHAADGTATATLSVTARLYRSDSYYMSFYNLSGSQTLDETRHFTLSISAGTGSTITVKRGSSTLSNGATLTHGDTLTISFTAQSGYELLTHTVNGASFTSGGTHTVTAAVTVSASARRLGLVRLDTGSAIQRYRLLLDTGSAIVPVRIFLDLGDRITEAGI